MRDSKQECSQRFTFARMTGAHRNRAGVARVSFIAFCLIALIMPSPALAEGGIEEELLGAIDLLRPHQDALSGSTWVVSQGLDPRMWGVVHDRDMYGVMEWDARAAPAPAPQTGNLGAHQPQVPFRSPGPAFSRNLIVTRQVGLFPIQTEPHVAVNPNDPQHLVLGVIDYNFPSMSTYTSFDGGQTWDGPNQVRYFSEDLTSAGDPVVTFDRDGNVYLTSISLGVQEFVIGTLVSRTLVSSMVVSKSTDGGLSWGNAVSAARSEVTTVSRPDPDGRERGTVTGAFLDKPWLSSGPDPENPDNDIIHLTYTEFATTFRIIYADEVPFLTSPFTETTIRYVQSRDGGLTWSEPLGVSPTVLQAEGASEEDPLGFSGIAAAGPDGTLQGASLQALQEPDTLGYQGEANRTVQGSQPKVMADGTVVIAYLDTTNDGIQEGLGAIMVTMSEDGGRTFDAPILAGVIREPPFRPRNAVFRYWGAAFPQIAVGLDEEIYILVTGLPPEKPTDDGDIYLLRSLDRGETWDPPTRLNGDDTDRLQFFPAIDVAPDGSVHAMWGDMRDDPDEARYHVYYTRSDDRGESWGFELPEQGFSVPDTRVTDFPSNSLRGFPGGRFIGDYFAIAATNDDVYLVWADTRLGEFGALNQQIGFARQTAIRAPALFLNPASGPAGRDVTIQGFDFQPLADIAIVVGGILVANERTNENGGFEVNLYMPVTGEGARDVRVFDETGNVATASFFTEFGFDTIQQSLEDVQRQIDQIQADQAPADTSAVEAATPAATPPPPPPADDDPTPTASSGNAHAGVSSSEDVAVAGFGGIGTLALSLVAYGGLFWYRRKQA